MRSPRRDIGLRPDRAARLKWLPLVTFQFPPAIISSAFNLRFMLAQWVCAIRMKCHQTICTRTRRRPKCWHALLSFPAWAGKFAPVGKVRDLYRRVQRSPEGFRLETLLAEMRVGLRVGCRRSSAHSRQRSGRGGGQSSLWRVGWRYSHRAADAGAARRKSSDQFPAGGRARVAEALHLCGSVSDRPIGGIEPASVAGGSWPGCSKAACWRFFLRAKCRTGRCRRRRLPIRSGTTRRSG